MQKPMVLGHEGSGVVRLVGADVEGLEEGDRVAIEPGVPCASCCNCKGGRYNLCASVKFAATPPVNGCLAHFVMHPASFCYKLPPMISFDEAALFEPLSVGIHACKRGNVKLGDIVLITGAGPIGLVTMLVAKASGASQVIILDIDAERLQVAKELGADRVISTHIAGDPKVTVEGIEADICVDATGVESAIRTCVYAAKRGGVVVIVGMGKPDVSLPVLEIGIKEIDIRGVFRYCNTYPIALELVASGKVQMKRLVTHRFKMFESADAFEAARDRSSKSIKVIIDCAPPPTVQGHGISSAAMHALGVPKSDLSGVTGQTVHTLSVQKQEMCTEAAPSAIISATMPATNTAATGITANGISTSGICGSGIPAGAIPTAGMAAGAISPTGIPATGDSKIGVRSTAVAAQGVHAGVISAQVVTSTGIHTPVLPTGGVPATDISTIGVPAASVAISGESAPDIPPQGIPSSGISAQVPANWGDRE